MDKHIQGSFSKDIVSISNILQLYRQGTKVLTEETNEEFYKLVIEPLKDEVQDYIQRFEETSNKYMRYNSTLSKMRKSIMTKGEIVSLEGITNKTLNNKRKTTKNMINIMQEGHSMLLDIREAFVGHRINTKFYIAVEGKTYIIDENKIKPNLMLSSYGGATSANPFSLAYQIDKELLESQKILEQAEEITNDEIFQEIMKKKPPYLDEYKTPKTGRIYKYYYFDSKDAEIYESYRQSKENILSLSVDKYASLRYSLGGGGGYASPFYKIGDIGSTQVKYFNIKKGEKSAVVNFARFGLLNTRFKELYNILNQDSLNLIGKNLQTFFTEKEKNISEEVSIRINKEAQQAFNKIFGL